jgi:hypothetical protein
MQKHKEGIVIRLHVLGDFYSVDYVKFWEEMLIRHPKLCLFGYTARKGDNIAHAIWLLNKRFSDRCVIRHSGNFEAGKPHGDSQDPFKRIGVMQPKNHLRVRPLIALSRQEL